VAKKATILGNLIILYIVSFYKNKKGGLIMSMEQGPKPPPECPVSRAKEEKMDTRVKNATVLANGHSI
jgi:hypothetical protein